jgi:hypothetical protein
MIGASIAHFIDAAITSKASAFPAWVASASAWGGGAARSEIDDWMPAPGSRVGVAERQIAARHSLGALTSEDRFLPSAGLARFGANPQRETVREGANAA